MSEPDPSSALRASDAERDRVAELLSVAHADGRLANEEYHHRLDRLYAGRTRGDLERLAEDLGGRDAVAETRSSELAAPERVGRQIAVLSKTMARPTGRVDGRLSAVSVLGDVQIDLSYATIGPEGVQIKAYAVAGAVNITVPADARVTMTGQPVVGSLSPTREPGPVSGPQVVVKAFAGLGSVTIHRAEHDNH